MGLRGVTLRSGLLSGALSRAAGKTVDVLEVQCGHGGSEPCWFMFGSDATLQNVRNHMARRRGPGETSPATADEH